MCLLSLCSDIKEVDALSCLSLKLVVIFYVYIWDASTSDQKRWLLHVAGSGLFFPLMEALTDVMHCS